MRAALCAVLRWASRPQSVVCGRSGFAPVRAALCAAFRWASRLRAGDVFVLTMQANDNRFNLSFLQALNDALDTVGQAGGPAALVTTGGTEKFYSNGLDLDWLGGDGREDAGSATGPEVTLACNAGAI